MKRKHGLLLFIATCIPGCGQMYQGYMKRGVSLMTAFCGILAVAVVLQLGALAIFLPLVWLFAFFDSYNIRGQSDEQAAANPDAYLFGLSDLDSQKMAELCRRRHSVIGWVLVGVGVYALYTTVVGRIMYSLADQFNLWWLRSLVMYDVPRVIATLAVICLGLWFIRGPKGGNAAVEEEIPAFTPPAAQAAQETPGEQEVRDGEQ